jgi:hypothetical protein
MSFSPNQYLKADPVEHFRCQQHAARTFVDDSFRLLPKTKFLYHVAFNINWPALNIKNIDTQMILTLKDEINLLVKSTDLPSYTVSHDVLNQYNRKRIAQYQHKYNEINMSFHDDNMGLINKLWQTYYKYYYADPVASNVKGAYKKNATLASSAIKSPYGYVGHIPAFFNYITIYQMSRHEYVSYKLMNPVITQWNGNKLAYADGNSHHFDFKIAYESVYYDVGFVSSGDMEGFGSLHYDFTPSPLTSSWPQDTAPYPSFANTAFGGKRDPAATTTVSTTAVTKTAGTTASTLVYGQTNTTSGLNGISVPQASSSTNTITATQVTTGNTPTTTATTGTSPSYTNKI